MEATINGSLVNGLERDLRTILGELEESLDVKIHFRKGDFVLDGSLWQITEAQEILKDGLGLGQQSKTHGENSEEVVKAVSSDILASDRSSTGQIDMKSASAISGSSAKERPSSGIASPAVVRPKEFALNGKEQSIKGSTNKSPVAKARTPGSCTSSIVVLDPPPVSERLPPGMGSVPVSRTLDLMMDPSIWQYMQFANSEELQDFRQQFGVRFTSIAGCLEYSIVQLQSISRESGDFDLLELAREGLSQMYQQALKDCTIEVMQLDPEKADLGRSREMLRQVQQVYPKRILCKSSDEDPYKFLFIGEAQLAKKARYIFRSFILKGHGLYGRQHGLGRGHMAVSRDQLTDFGDEEEIGGFGFSSGHYADDTGEYGRMDRQQQGDTSFVIVNSYLNQSPGKVKARSRQTGQSDLTETMIQIDELVRSATSESQAFDVEGQVHPEFTQLEHAKRSRSRSAEHDKEQLIHEELALAMQEITTPGVQSPATEKKSNPDPEYAETVEDPEPEESGSTSNLVADVHSKASPVRTYPRMDNGLLMDQKKGESGIEITAIGFHLDEENYFVPEIMKSSKAVEVAPCHMVPGSALSGVHTTRGIRDPGRGLVTEVTCDIKGTSHTTVGGDIGKQDTEESDRPATTCTSYVEDPELGVEKDHTFEPTEDASAFQEKHKLYMLEQGSDSEEEILASVTSISKQRTVVKETRPDGAQRFGVAEAGYEKDPGLIPKSRTEIEGAEPFDVEHRDMDILITENQGHKVESSEGKETAENGLKQHIAEYGVRNPRISMHQDRGEKMSAETSDKSTVYYMVDSESESEEEILTHVIDSTILSGLESNPGRLTSAKSERSGKGKDPDNGPGINEPARQVTSGHINEYVPFSADMGNDAGETEPGLWEPVTGETEDHQILRSKMADLKISATREGTEFHGEEHRYGSGEESKPEIDIEDESTEEPMPQAASPGQPTAEHASPRQQVAMTTVDKQSIIQALLEAGDGASEKLVNALLDSADDMSSTMLENILNDPEMLKNYCASEETQNATAHEEPTLPSEPMVRISKRKLENMLKRSSLPAPEFQEVMEKDGTVSLQCNGTICTICIQPMSVPFRLDCGHTFCVSCVRGELDPSGKGQCPVCGARLQLWLPRQPEGKMELRLDKHHSLSGYSTCGTATLVFTFHGGIQKVLET